MHYRADKENTSSACILQTTILLYLKEKAFVPRNFTLLILQAVISVR